MGTIIVYMGDALTQFIGSQTSLKYNLTQLVHQKLEMLREI